MSESLHPIQILARLRQGGTVAEQALTILHDDTSLRALVAAELAAALLPGDHALVRQLLTMEITAHEQAGQGASDTLYTLVAALARYAAPQDSLLIWRAHEATPATRTGIDIEQMLRAGVAPVTHWLRTRVDNGSVDATQATAALAWLEAGLAAGAADDLPGYFAWADERFGLHVAGPT